jgi:hypothetical protein
MRQVLPVSVKLVDHLDSSHSNSLRHRGPQRAAARRGWRQPPTEKQVEAYSAQVLAEIGLKTSRLRVDEVCSQILLL